jgi:flavin reductase (DIM6/NTAB) family NADH-FMN oxidoreductase RutF/pimeloyl-ACP methyl ester carboxylesterase
VLDIALYGAGGIRLAVDAVGDPQNPCVLLLPGFGQTRGAWASVAKALGAAGRYAVTVDLRGHGDSDWSPDRAYALGDIVQDVLAILKQLPDRPAIVGASIGGLAALAAIGESERSLASALVLVDAAPRMSRLGMDRSTLLMTRDAEGFGSVQEAAQVLAELSDTTTEAIDLAELREHLRRADDGRYRWHLDPAYKGFEIGPEGRLAAQQRFMAAAQMIDLPTLLVRGQHSDIVDQHSVDAFKALVPHADVAEIPGAGNVMIGRRNDAFDIAVLEFLEHASPRPGPRPQGGFEPALLRAALGCFATGVTVITTCDADGAPMGFTASSFTSVSMEPPLVLFCIRRGSPNVTALRQRQAFAVNVLHIGQQPVSARFASWHQDRFATTEWEVWEHEVPIILDAAANFECTIDEMVDGGDHVIVIGRVRRVHFDAARDPLLYFQGQYRRIHVTRA